MNVDATRINQIFFDLLGNAVRFALKETGSLKAQGAKWGGKDISARQRHRDYRRGHLKGFEMFSQIDAVPSQGGQDIELALVRGLVELHGGTVEVRTLGIGHGSKFFM